RILHGGLGTGLAPTGCKWMRRAPHSKRAPPWRQLNKRNRNFNGKRRINRNATFAAQRSLSLGTRFRRQPLAPSGATLRAPGVDRESAAKQRACRAINAELRSRAPVET